jgi:hypothetical protein
MFHSSQGMQFSPNAAVFVYMLSRTPDSQRCYFCTALEHCTSTVTCACRFATCTIPVILVALRILRSCKRTILY